MWEYFNRREAKSLRRRLRNEMPPAEVALWSRLRGRQLLGRKFRRQFGVGPYCLDFCCPELGLAIELDGDTHFTDVAMRLDVDRQAWVESFGIRFLRFTNTDVHENLDGVLEAIADAIEAIASGPRPASEGVDRGGSGRPAASDSPSA